jgi:hypothetical protein
MHVFPPLTAEKVLLSLYVILFTTTWAYLCRGLAGRATPAVYLAFPFAYSLPFQFGFFGFMLSLAAAFAAVGFYWRRRERPGPAVFIIINLLGLATYVTHLLGWAILVAGVIGAAFAHGVRLLGARGNTASNRRARAGWWFATPLYLAPAVAPGVAYILGQETGGARFRLGWGELALRLIRTDALFSFNIQEKYAALASGAVIAALAAALIVARLTRRRATEPAWRFEDAVCGAAFALATLAYFIVPDTTPSGGGYVSNRLALLPPLALVALAAAARERWFRTLLFFVAPAVAVAHLPFMFAGWRQANVALRDFTRGRYLMYEGATFLPVVWYHHPGAYNKIHYLEHAGSYYTLGTYAVDLTNYEASRPYFPVVWRADAWPMAPYFGGLRDGVPYYDVAALYPRADFILFWRVDTRTPEMKAALARYECVLFREKLEIYRRRPMAGINAGAAGPP